MRKRVKATVCLLAIGGAIWAAHALDATQPFWRDVLLAVFPANTFWKFFQILWVRAVLRWVLRDDEEERKKRKEEEREKREEEERKKREEREELRWLREQERSRREDEEYAQRKAAWESRERARWLQARERRRAAARRHHGWPQVRGDDLRMERSAVRR
ncbi:hypothetical protein KEM55_004761, partial [Ascosphaera atra]